MRRLGSAPLAVVATLALAWSVPALAVYPGSCANGQIIYNKTNPATGVVTSCSNSSCHKSDVSAKNIQNGSGNPGAINNALDGTAANAEMVALDLRNNLPLSSQDIDDLATWIFYAPTCPAGGSPNLQAAPAPVSFGSVTVGATSGTTTVTITNVGTAAALAVTASSSDPTHFPLSANTCSGVSVGNTAPNNKCTFAVAFHPTVSGAASGTITINRTGGTLTVGVSGTGTSSASPGQLSMNTSLSFGNQTISTTSAINSIAISNIGGSSVSVSSVSSSNPSEFTVASNNCVTVVAGGGCSIGVTFKPGAVGARSGSLSIVSNGTGSPQSVALSGTGAAVGTGPATVTVVEYYYPPFDHYFITSKADEIAALDAKVPPFQDWSRTGLTFTAWVNASAPAGSAAICRFFNDSPAFAPKSSHFYAPKGLGCEDTLAAFPDWKLENDKLFNVMLPNADGTCAAGTIPVYRLYNNGQGGSPNHRFVTSKTVQQSMLAKGYVAEPAGTGVGMCVPP